MFQLIPFAEWEKDNARTSIPILLKTILGSQQWRTVRYKKGVPQPIYNNEDDSWLADLAYETVHQCFEFFKDHQLITSNAHMRLVEEVDDLLNSEVGRSRWVSRNFRNVRF